MYLFSYNFDDFTCIVYMVQCSLFDKRNTRRFITIHLTATKFTGCLESLRQNSSAIKKKKNRDLWVEETVGLQINVHRRTGFRMTP